MLVKKERGLRVFDLKYEKYRLFYFFQFMHLFWQQNSMNADQTAPLSCSVIWDHSVWN